MKIVIDRFEGDYAVAKMENKEMVNLPRVLVSEEKEGDVITIDVDHSVAKRGFEDVTNLMDNIWKR